MESVSQQPLFRDDSRGGQVFAVVLFWTIFYSTDWQILMIFRGLTDFCFLFIIGLGITFIVVVLQVHVAEKVYPLLYITPLVDLMLLEGLTSLGFLDLSALFTLIVFLVAVNCLILALAWDEMTNRSTSGVSNLWMSIMPVACLMMLSSSAALRLGIEGMAYGSVPLEWVAWFAIWLALIIGLAVLFVRSELRADMPSEEWFLPPTLLVWAILTYTIGPAVVGLTGFSLPSILALITSSMALFGVASAELETLMTVPEGRFAAGLALTGGYVLTLVCAFLSLTLFLL